MCECRILTLTLVFGVKMRWVVVQEEHLDDDPIEAAEFRHWVRRHSLQLPDDILLGDDPKTLFHFHQYRLTSIA
jgi:hypothetical protein